MDHDQSYQDALDYLYSFIDYSLVKSSVLAQADFDLTRMDALLQYLGNPHLQYKVIHVTGTKGKGSTSAMIASCLHQAGYKVGFFSSPHLEEYNERIQINGKMISDGRFVEIVEKMKSPVEIIQRLTTFELTTAIAFKYFAEEQVDIAVVEVGLGGRLDATNLVDPILSIITPISFDHTAVLGNTLEKIAFEKSGIIKQGRPVLSGLQRNEAFKVIQSVVAERNAPLTCIGEDYRFVSIRHDLKEQVFSVWPKEDQERMNAYLMGQGSANWEPELLHTPLLGYHQIENAATACAALAICRQNGLEISKEAEALGFQKVFWPCRFEIISEKPLLIIDSAHNVDSGHRLRVAIDDYLAGKPVVLLYGSSEDKDVYGIFQELVPRAKAVVVTESIHPRAMELKVLAELVSRFGMPVYAVKPIEDALNKALEIAGEDSAIVTAGSLFIAAGVRQAWEKLGHKLQSFETA